MIQACFCFQLSIVLLFPYGKCGLTDKLLYLSKNFQEHSISIIVKLIKGATRSVFPSVIQRQITIKNQTKRLELMNCA